MLDRLYYVFFQKPSKGKTERHLLGRFMTHGNNLRIIEDYHDQLADSLPEGPIDLHSLQLMDRLKQNPYIKVISQKEIDQDPEFAEFASDEKHPEAEPLETTGGSTFEYHQRGVATPQIIEFRGGVPHLNNAALSPEEIDAIKHNVMNGIGKIVHKPNLEKSVKKMEGVFKKLLKKDDDEEAPPHPDDVTEAFSFLRKLIETNPEAAKHERTLAKLIFKDSMVPKVGSKYAHQDFLSRPQEGTHVVLDGNDFKSINDAYGHPIGDVAIKAFGKALRESVDEAGEGKGKAFRMGGDEFAAHFPNHEHAARFGRIMREKLDAIPPIGGTHKLSMAMGFGQSIGDADKALYMAKEQKLHPETKQPLYPKGQAPTMAHSLMPGHEGPIPLSPEMPSMKVSGPKPPSLKMPEPSSTPNTTELNKSEELQKMAISSIPQGRRLFQKASGSQVYDYSHALTPKQRAAGYEMRVEHYPDNNLHVSIERHSRPVGFVHAAFSGDTIKPIQSEIEEPFRNQGLGTQAYEALLAHGFHHGAKSVAGGSHSTSASKVHQKLAERHGTEYNATPAPKEVRKKKVGPFDSRVGQYEYTLKSEVDLSKKILDPSSGYTISHVMDSPSHIRVLAHHGGKIIGALHLDRLQPGAQNISAFNVQVEPAHQRKGVASAMYAHAEKVTGLKIKPSSYQSRDGRQLWEGNEHTPQFGKSENNLINELHKYSSDTEEEHEAEELSKAFVSQYGGQLPNKDNSHASKNEWWHGSPSGKFPLNNIHVGSKQAAHEALTARIGHPVSGEWDGTREYGKTLLAGKNTLRAKGIPVTGYSNDAPDEDHFPSGRAKYSDGTQVDFSEKPAMFRVRIKGQMSDNWNTPRTDRAANAIMKRKGVKRGVYYVNEGEDVGSISAVVPAFDTHLEILDGKLAKEEELNKVTLTPDSVSNRMKPHQVYPDTSYDRVESYDLGNGLWHHAYYGSGEPNEYRSVHHSLSNSENPLHSGFVTSSAGLVPGNYQKHLGGFANNPWEDAEPVIIHGETTSVGPKGSGTMFYRNMAKIHGRMASDSSTSPAADAVWRKMVNDPDFRGQLGPEKGQRHWVEHKGPKPVPTKVIEGDGRSLKAQIETPVNPYRTEIHKFADKNGVGVLEAHTYHGDQLVGNQTLYMDHQKKTLHTAGPYYTSRGILQGSHIDFNHSETGAGGVGLKNAERETGYKYMGDVPTEMADKFARKP